MIRIIGIGSPLGDDAAGLEAARRLAAVPPPHCEIVAADRPGLGLIDLFEGAEAVIVIDAARSGAPPGTLHDLDLRRFAHDVSTPASSHAFGVAAALQLAAQLGRAPAYGRVLGVEIAPAAGRGPGTLTPTILAGVARVVRRARRWADRLADDPSSRRKRPEASAAREKPGRRDTTRAGDLQGHSRRGRRRAR